MYIARNKNGTLWLHFQKPEMCESQFYDSEWKSKNYMVNTGYQCLTKLCKKKIIIILKVPFLFR